MTLDAEAEYASTVSNNNGFTDGRKSIRIPLSNDATLSPTCTRPLFWAAGRNAILIFPGASMCSNHCDFCSSPVVVYLVLFWRNVRVLKYLPSYFSRIAPTSPVVLAILPAGNTTFVADGFGVPAEAEGSGAGLLCPAKEEHPAAINAAASAGNFFI